VLEVDRAGRSSPLIPKLLEALEATMTLVRRPVVAHLAP